MASFHPLCQQIILISVFIFYPYILYGKKSYLKSPMLQPMIRLDLHPHAQKIPVYDQNGLGSCYAHATAQFIDFYRFIHDPNSQKTEVLTSPIKLAIDASVIFRNNFDPHKNSIYEGRPDDAIAAARRYGICDYQATNPKSIAPLEYHFSKIATIHESFRTNLQNQQFKPTTVPYPINPESCKYSFQQLFSQPIPTDLIELAFKQNQNTLDVLKEIADHACAPFTTKLDLPMTINKDRKFLNLKTMESVIKDQLSKLKPVLISYCQGILTNSEHEGITPFNQIKKACNPHGSVILGMKRKNNQTYFLVRNSWGVSCQTYVWDCENGQVWIPEKKLMKNTYQITYFP